ncbi:MAG TPA: nuclear transport factor 2 family protein [Ktedonobacterales bacterium]|nr:nuclear transport factor 2 family protein [Ktedonobacterales bacterium]
MYTRLLKHHPLALALVTGLLLLGLAACATASAAPATPRDTRAEAVVLHQFQLFNVGMASGDFAAFDQVFAPDATLTTSNPAGVTTVHQGLAAIIAYYQAFQAAHPLCRWTVDSMRSLSESVVLTYDHACSPPQSVAGRCEHLFVVHAGLIQTYDWTTFYPGKP